MLQWLDPDTGRRKSKSAKTADPEKAEEDRCDLESDLNNGRYAEASRMSWAGFRELFEAEYLPNARPRTRAEFRHTLDSFERLCNPQTLKTINERKVSAFAAALWKEPGRKKGNTGMMASTVKIRLQVLHTVLTWAAKQKLIKSCPEFPKIKVPKKRPQPVPAESVEKLLAKADATTRVFLQCGWLAGMRLAEAYALEREQAEQGPPGWTWTAIASSSRPSSSRRSRISGCPWTRPCGLPC
jgi:integrase